MGAHKIKDLLKEDLGEISLNRNKVRLALLVCALIFQYSIIGDELLSINLNIPGIGNAIKLGWTSLTLLLTSLCLSSVAVFLNFLRLFF